MKGIECVLKIRDVSVVLNTQTIYTVGNDDIDTQHMPTIHTWRLQEKLVSPNFLKQVYYYVDLPLYRIPGHTSNPWRNKLSLEVY